VENYIYSYCIIKVEKRYTDEWLRCLAGNPFCVALAKQKDWEAGSGQKLTIGICIQPQSS
jgi:hypothetical protein